MDLTRSEERIYNGESGWTQQTCMKILVRLGELFDASKLIPIQSAHVSGVSYKTLGDAPADFLKALADNGGKTSVRATLNPQSLDREYLPKRLPSKIVKNQLNILRQFDRMGFSPSLTCTPYYLEQPSLGGHLAWAESSAVVYANSVLKTWTNREGGPSALAAAIIGKTPDYGVHKPENREPNVLVEVDAQLRNEAEFGALGLCLGKSIEDRIPFIRGIDDATETDLKQLGAALASSGMVNLFHRPSDLKIPKTQFSEKINIGREEIRHTTENLCTVTRGEKPDLVFIGCPHCSQKEIAHIAEYAEGKKVKSDVEFWVCTSRCVKQKMKQQVARIERSGVHVLADVCTIVSWTELLNIKTIMTNSAKTAYYAPSLSKAETILAPMNNCLEAAFRG